MQDDITKCKECQSRNIITDIDKGEIVCGDCGLVHIERLIDPGPEWRTGSSMDSSPIGDNSRVGMPDAPLLHDGGKGTIFNFRDVHGSSKKKSQFYRMRKWQQIARINNNVDRNLAANLGTLKKITSSLGIAGDTAALSAEIYRKAVENRLIQGRSNDTMIAASIYGATKMRCRPRTLPEISRHARVGQKEIGKGWRLIRKELKLKVPVSKPEDFVDRFCSDLQLSMKIRSKAYEIITLLHENEYTNGRSPTVMAAGSIYIAGIIGGEKRTQREIAEITDVTEVSIRTCFKHIEELYKEAET